MELKELLQHFDNGGSFGDDPEILLTMRKYIQETRRLLYEINNVWHEDESEIAEFTGSEENIPHIRTFHSLAYAVANRNVEDRKHIVFDNDEENLFDIKDKRKALSQVVQKIIQSMISENPDNEAGRQGRSQEGAR